MHLVRPILLPDAVCLCPELIHPAFQRLGFIKEIPEHLPHRLRLGLIHALDHSTREMIHGGQKVIECGRRFPEHSEEVRCINVPDILEVLHCLPFVDFVADVCREVLLVSGDNFLEFGAANDYHSVAI